MSLELTEDEADEVVTDMVAELGLGEPAVDVRANMRAAVLKIARLLVARGWRLERSQ